MTNYVIFIIMKKINKIKILSIFLIAFIVLVVLVDYKSPVKGQNESAINAEIELLNQQISEQQKRIDEINQKRKEYESLVNKAQSQAASLNNQLVILNSRISQAELEIENTEIQITKTNLQIQKLRADGLALDRSIDKQKENITHLLRLSYRQGQVSTLEILLLNDSLTDFLNQIKYLDNTSKEINKNVSDLKISKELLEKNQENLEEQGRQLNNLKNELISTRNSLEYEKQSKVFVLEETKETEKEYQSLIAQAKREHQQAQADISNLEVAVRQKLASLSDDPLKDSDSKISWPIPKNVITARFHDPRYPYRHIIGEHSGIDIRAAQGTTLRAAADGYVARVKFDGTSTYAYIMIIHANNLSTVYGHVSAVNVSADQFVVQGQIIGKTGGAPGSPGSGSFSTGPHLHFEVRLNGLPVNPLNYLP
jgi:murein DD-endopeptidase MepM/ murein hydrolase activator NlpD